ncbi:glycogen synthase GlgA [Dendrosporobacter sp. 1207_IL3150]|uniref:glycogen synthase GlgA n=1 Tax=Dendrosporobacter sp. 1207_IL3150 TaxID=3084054 RepID=UPI002FD944D7
MMKVLFTAAEAVPFIKTGGLGDVIGSLPKELSRNDIDVRVIMPRYRDIAPEYLDKMVVTHRIIVPVGWRQQVCDISCLEYEGVTFYFIGNEYCFDRPGLYGFPDDSERFAFFCRAVLEALPHIEFRPDILHCHDWHSGMISVLLEAHYRENPFYSGIKTIFTIHNLAYQGNFPKEILGDLFNLGWEFFNPEGVEFSGQVSFMKGALNFSDYITTVSGNYAEEILQPDRGQNMDGLLRSRRKHLIGIRNGIDYSEYNPAKDSLIYTRFDARSLRRRRENKLKLQETLGLWISEDIPVIGLVARLVHSKGFDLISQVLEEILALNTQIVLLGQGEEGYQKLFEDAAAKYPDRVSANITFSNELARQIYAGADIFLMPSQYEPCGLSQLNAMRYGCIPLVFATGGLKETVEPFNYQTGEGTGFVFSEYEAEQLLFTVKMATEVYRNKKAWNKLIRSAMKSDFSWRQSSQQYKALYGELINK